MNDFETKSIAIIKVHRMCNNDSNSETKEIFDTCIKYINRVIKYAGKLNINVKWLFIQKAKLIDSRFRFLTKDIINKQISDM